MTGGSLRKLVAAACVAALLLRSPAVVRAADVTKEQVEKSIELAKKFLLNQQKKDGSWSTTEGAYPVGVSSLALLALMNAGMKTDDPAVQRGLGYLRSIKEPDPGQTYEISLMSSALSFAKDGQRDKARLLALAGKLERSQITDGDGTGSWSYSANGGILNLPGDRSNAQYAVLGLRDAADAGIPVERIVWERAREHWTKSQSADGGWGYAGLHGQASTGSMTVAGISTMVIVQSMLGSENDFEPDGQTPNCCNEEVPEKTLDRAIRWMATNFAVGSNPGGGAGGNRIWHFYYLYGLERAGRLSGMRFFGEHDWYREGARVLVESQNATRGFWQGDSHMEKDPTLATSFALLFLSKGMAPVLINKLQYGKPDAQNRLVVTDNNWNKHRNDIRNLTDLISGLPKWPKLLTWQTVNMNTLEKHGNAQDLAQSPVAFLTGSDAPQLTERQVELLRDYVAQGGFIFACANCNGGEFDQGFRDLIRRMYPKGDAELKKLGQDHPIFRAEYLLDPETVHLEGVDLGCRTPIVYSPDDLSCFWDKWARHDPPKRNARMKTMIERGTRIGVNVIAYATGREPPNKLEQQEQLAKGGSQDRIERGFLQIVKLRHTGGWDAAPQSLRNLLMALNQTVGMAASTQIKTLPITDQNLFRYPIAFMHGRNSFQLNRQERDQLKEYVKRGGVLVSDAACGARPYDQSFRSLMEEMYGKGAFKRIPMTHEIFTTTVGHDIRRVRRRMPEVDNPNAPLNTKVTEGEPFLEGIEIDGRWAVIYSKYDLSCTIERQASVACAGYVPDDALKIAVNIILYSLLQEVALAEEPEE